MASALLNMMMDDEKKNAQPPAGSPSTPPVPAGQPAPQMPPPATAQAPQQASSGTAAAPDLGGLLDLLAQGKGPVKPKAAGPIRRGAPIRGAGGTDLPAYDWRSAEGGNKPAFTEYEGESSVDPISGKVTFTPKLDANGNKIIKKAGRDLDYEAAAQAAEAQGSELPDTQTRIRDVRTTNAGISPRTSAQDLMESARYDADVESAFQAGALTQEQRDAQLGSRQRPNFGQGFTTEIPKSEFDLRQDAILEKNRIAREGAVDIDPLSQAPAAIRTTLRTDTLIRDTVKKGGIANNPFAVVQTVHNQLQGEARKNLTRAENLDRGLISEIGSIWSQNTTINENHPFTQIARTSYGKTLDEVMVEYKRNTGQDLFTPTQLDTLRSQISTKSAQYRAEADAITQSAGYHILSNAIRVGNEQQFNNAAKTRIAKGAIAYIASIPDNDQANVDDAKRYFNTSLYGDPTMEMYKQGIEDWYASDPVLGVIFKRGNVGQYERKDASLDKVRGATAMVLKNAIDDANEHFVSGAGYTTETGTRGVRTARAAAVRLMNSFTTSFYDSFSNNDPVQAFKDLGKTSFGRYFANSLAYNLQVVDSDNTIKQIFDSDDNEAKQVIMDAVTAPFGVKKAMRNLFTFDIAGKEDQFELDVPKVQEAMKAGDMGLAKRIMAPYASTDQLDVLFGDREPVEGQGKQRDIKLIDLENMTGAGGSRRQRIDAYLARKQSFATADEKYAASQLKMSPEHLIARLAGNFYVDTTIFGGFKGETKKAYNTGFIADTDKETAAMSALADIETYLAPTKGGAKAIANDPLFAQTLDAVDDAINKLNFQIESKQLDGYQESSAKDMLAELRRVREKAMNNLDDFVSVGAGRQHLFVMTPDGPDYSKPISASGSASRVSQVTDMLNAWITGDSKVDINRYFSSTGSTTARSSNSVLVTPVDREGNPIPTQMTVSVKRNADGFVDYPVYEKQGSTWVQAKDIFGRPMTSSAPLNNAQQQTAALLGKAANDASSGRSVNADYKRMQVNDLRVHLQNIVEPSGPDAAERRKYLIEEIGIYVDKNNRIENSEVLKFLQKANPRQGRQLLGFLDAYGESDSLRPDAQVNWAMNATSTRGRSFGTAEKAITGLEKEAQRTAIDQHRSTVFAMANQAKNVIRAYADELMDGRGIADPNSRAAAADQVMKGLVKSMPMIGADNMQTAQVRDYMRDYIDAYLSDDRDQIRVVNTQLRDFVENFDVTAEAADAAQQQIIRGSKTNIQKPVAEPEDNRPVAEKLEAARQENERTRAANRAKQKYYVTEFFPELGWIYAEGSERDIKQIRELATTARKVGSSRGLNPKEVMDDNTVTIRQASYKDIEVAKKGQPDFKKVAGGTKINRRPAVVQSAAQGKATKAPNIADTPAVLLKGKPKGNAIGKLGVLGGFGASLGAVGGRGGR